MFVFFTRILSFLSLMRSLLIACCYLVAHIVGYGGTLIEWLREQLEWTMQTVRALTVPKRGLLV